MAKNQENVPELNFLCYNVFMNSNCIEGALTALEYLKQGLVLCQQSRPVLFRQQKNKVRVISLSYTCLIEPDDFLELYERESFVFYEPQETLDEARDEEYYAWRSRSQ